MSEPAVIVVEQAEPTVVVVGTATPISVVAPVTETATLVTGLQGPPGPQGKVGPAGDAPVMIAAITLSGHRALAADSSGEAIYADASDLTAQAVQGIGTNAAVAGETVYLAKSGPLVWPPADLTPGLPVFLGAVGALTHTPPDSGWVRQMGVATATNLLSVDIGPAIRVGA